MIRPLLLLASVQLDVRIWERFEALGREPDAIVSDGPSLWRELGINERSRSVMSGLLASGWIDREMDACERLGVRLVSFRDAAYPRSLLDLRDAPLLIYARGVRLLQPRVVGIVGTRRCSSYAAGVARDLARESAARGWSVVSGGARGIDAAAHEGCLGGGGITAAVLGTGVDVVYPPEHGELFERIRGTGALLSEFPLGARGDAWRFPRRNRIIAGLSSRTVVVEAPERSGALITARFAADGGRDVWVVPGRITDDRSIGSNRLMFDGAFPLTDMDTFFGGCEIQRLLFDGVSTAPEPAALNNPEKILVALLTNSGDRTIDNMASEAKMSAAEVFRTISMLSLRGLVYSSGAGRYRLTD
jgi:DNA processing protein